MLPVRSRVAVFRAFLLLLAATTATAASYAGRPVRAVLQELQRTGITLIYNDVLVPDDLRVLGEPAATGGIALLNEILAPHGLAARSIGTGTWVIVAARPSGGGAADAAAAPRRSPTALQEVVVTASQYKLAQHGPESRTFLTQDELRSLPKLADEPLRAVHRLPGAASNGLSGLAHMRGGDENETQILLDGMPLQEPFHLRNFFSPVSLLDPEVVGALDVYAGGFPADYGGRMSAVVDAQSVDPSTDGTYALGLSLFHLNALAGATFAGDRGRWLASARRSNLKEVINLSQSDLGEPTYLDAFLKGEYDLGDNTTLAAHALLAEDRVQVNNPDQTEFASTSDQSAYVWTSVEHRWSRELLGRALLAWTSVNKDRAGTLNDPGSAVGSVSDLRDSSSALLTLEVEQGNDQLRWRAGLDGAWLEANYDYTSRYQTEAGVPFPNDPAQSIERDSVLTPEGTQAGAFVVVRWRATDALTGEAGLRWDHQTYDPLDSDTQFSPRINLLYDASSRTQVRASWGRFYQVQGINELQVEDGIETFFPAQRADHIILSLEHAFDPGVSARVEAYYKDYEDLKPRYENVFNPLVVLPELQTDRVQVAPAAGRVRGLEFLVRDRSAEPWGWWLSYTWSRAEETVDGVDVPRSWDQRHAFNGGLSWTRGRWDVALAGTWHTGWPTTPVSLGPGVDPDVLVGARNSARFDDFRSLDLRAGYTVELGNGELRAFVEFINLLGLKNPCCVEYTVVDTGASPPVLQQDVDYWPRFVPNLGVLWKF